MLLTPSSRFGVIVKSQFDDCPRNEKAAGVVEGGYVTFCFGQRDMSQPIGSDHNAQRTYWRQVHSLGHFAYCQVIGQQGRHTGLLTQEQGFTFARVETGKIVFLYETRDLRREEGVTLHDAQRQDITLRNAVLLDSL